MTMSLESIEAEALKLTAEERALLVERLVSTIVPEFRYEQEWHAEIERRLVAIESDDSQLIPIEDALAAARRTIV